LKLNWAERWAVNNPLRIIEQRWELRWMARRAGLPPGAAVLEIGCGRGAGAAQLLREFGLLRIFASDLDLDMIRRAEDFLRPADQGRIRLFVADALHLPHRTGSLDAVFGFGVLHHIPDWRGALAEIARVLKPGGLYFLEELYPSLYQNFLTKHVLLHPAEDRFRSEDLKLALVEAGLRPGPPFELKSVGILSVCRKEG
jgi:ubiquinone/menaquinone biosynthesis C-methylase UbiE